MVTAVRATGIVHVAQDLATDRAARPDLVVVFSPIIQLFACGCTAHVSVGIQSLHSELAVEGLNEDGMVREHANKHTAEWAAIFSIAEKMGCSAETERLWVRRSERDRGGGSFSLCSERRDRLKAPERENSELRQCEEDQGTFQ